MEKERLTEELGSTEINKVESPETDNDMTSEQFTDGYQQDAVADPVEEMDNHAVQDEPTQKEISDIEKQEESTPESDNSTEEQTSNNTEVDSSAHDAGEYQINGAVPEEPNDKGDAQEDANVEPDFVENTPSIENEPVVENEPKTDSTESVEISAQGIAIGAPAKESKEEAPIVAEHLDSQTVEPEPIDYSKSSKKELQEALVEFVREDDIAKVGHALSEIKKYFDLIEKSERELALTQFIEEGGEKDDFKFQLDPVSQKLLANYQILRERRQKYFKQLERQKEENLNIKNEILGELRDLVDGEESTTSIKVINTIRDKWRSTGPIPRQFNKTLWANYNALMDRFYDNRSIYFELKELDRKKNLELKIELCRKVEDLALKEDLKSTIIELNNLHDDFKHIGPVPQENQEELWLRFKAASDTIYAKRKDYIEEIKDQLQENLVEKTALCEQIEDYSAFLSDRITEWNDKTKEIQELQKKWEKIGGLPRDKSKSINRRFWSALKMFFANKTKFFKSLEGQKEDNLKLKETLVIRAEELKGNDDFLKTAELLKKLQQEWREIGPVPEKMRNDVYKRFKATCDEFFDRKRASVKESEKEFEGNLLRKKELCDQLEEISNSDKIDLDIVATIQTQFSKIGFVPRSALKGMNQRYDEVLSSLQDKLNESQLSNKEQLSMEIEIRKMKGRPGAEKQIERQGQNLRKKITSIENDISTWKNNLEFFRASKTADKLKKEFDIKIDAANEELKQLKKQLRMMQAV